MQKSKILDIVTKYSLNGRGNSVLINVDENQKLTINFRPADRQYFFNGNFEKFDLEETEIGIYDTEALVKIMSALDNEFKMKIGYERKKPFTLQFEDSAIDVKFLLADTSLEVFAKPDGQKAFPDQHVTFELDKETMSRFIKSKNAIGSDKINFVLLTDGNKIDLILNYSETSTNRIQMTVEGEVTTQLDEPLAFSADIVKDIFAANMNCATAKFEASLAGLLTLTFEGEDWSTKYLVPKMQLG